MSRAIQATALALGLSLGLALGGWAARAADFPGLDDKVSGHPGVTYLDLVKQVVPDLAPNADNKDIEGSLAKPLRHIAGATYEGPPPDPIVAESFLEVRHIVAGGKKRLVLLEDLGADPDRAYDTALLALYDDEPPVPKLIEALDVGVDRDTTFAEHGELALGPGETALVTLSEHTNSNEAYDGWQIILVRATGFQLVDDVFLFSDHACGWDRTEQPTFFVQPDPGAHYAKIGVTVVEERKRNDEDCGDDRIPKPYQRIWRTIWRWDAKAGKFVDTVHGLDRLDKLNEPRL